MLARRADERSGIRQPRGRAEVLVEGVADLFLLQMDRRQHDVARSLLAELDDPLAEICVHDVDAARLEIRVEPALLGEHRLALDEATRPRALENAVHDL